jgi:hypothetical protein
MDDDHEELPEGDVDIESIMAEIRRQLLSRNVGPGQSGVSVPLSGERFSPEFYERLYLTGLASNEMHIYLDVAPSNAPLIGPLIDRLRRAFHQLVLFYVHKVVERQADVNRNMLSAISTLSVELEAERAEQGEE